jgi:uncharacterized protein (DUF2336 family)
MRAEAEQGLDVTVFEAVLQCDKAEARQVLARQLAGLAADAETSALEQEQILPILLKLAADTERKVRGALVGELLAAERLPDDLIFAIIADEDRHALAFLASSPALNAWHMQAILRVGDEGRQKTIASRADLSAEAVLYVVRAGTAAAVAALLNNAHVELRPQDLHLIYGRLPQAPDVVERLLARADLPLDIRITQARRAAVRMRQMMAERGWMPANDANEVVADAEEGAVLQVLRNATDDERSFAMQFLASQNMLTPSLIVRAACLGDVAVVASALGHLGGQKADRVVSLMLSRGGSAMKSLLNRSMLPTACHAIIACASDVAAQARMEDVVLDADGFGRRLLEVLMMQFGALAPRDQAKLMDYVGRFADDKVRKIAKKLKTDILRAA